MKSLYDAVSIQCSRRVTHTYSTSFSIGVRCLHPSLRDHIHSIYGFVRLADEIVDSFHDFDKLDLLQKLRTDTLRAIEDGISINPILNSFQATAVQFGIERELIELFLNSMRLDLERKSYDHDGFKEYVLGSAEAVGLMCLKVFCRNDVLLYQNLTPAAMSLGAAFQKVNFLRDIKADYSGLGRSYFPYVDPEKIDEETKKLIEQDIERDFRHAYEGIRRLPRRALFGVYVAYIYYLSLFRKIKATPARQLMTKRIRIHNQQKAGLLAYSYLKYQFSRL